MKVGIVGAGIAGLAAAYDLLATGHEVTLFEASAATGGLATGFYDEKWAWPLEKFYHHLFASDKEMLRLVDELGIRDKLFFPRPVTSVIYEDRIVPFSDPVDWIKFPGFNWVDIIRYGLVGAYLRFSSPWRQLEKVTADAWLSRWYGRKIYETVWRPLLINKMGPYFQDVNMAWMWARLKARTFRLGYFEGGFQFLVDTLTAAVEERGGHIRLNAPVTRICPQPDGRLQLTVDGRQEEVDRCLVTVSPKLLSRMAPDLPSHYLDQLLKLKSMGAVVLILALERPLMANSNTYWLNLPAVSFDKSENEIPFISLVEHTNFIDKKYYGGDRLIYCGDYVPPDHHYFEMSKEALEALFVEALPKINPEFRPEWVRKSWLFRARYAQPVPFVNHSQNIPDLHTPLSNLYFASMSQVYPWDRGTNFAVEIGRRAAGLMLADAQAQGAEPGKEGR